LKNDLPIKDSFRILGLIPARGGSKGVPRKNICLVADLPLIAYTIEAAKKSRLLTDFVTSTEDPEIATIAKELGSTVLTRPTHLAANDTPLLRVVRQALEVLEPVKGRYDYFIVLQPTSPQRTEVDIDAALRLLVESHADSVVSVYQVEDHHPARMYKLIDGKLVPYEKEPPERLRQQLAPVYHRNGAIYACRRSLIDEQNTLTGLNTRPYIMPRERSINIDDELDLAFADFLFRKEKKEPKTKSDSH
jgi:CMP-N-acetylneuraminic acid synthetase